MFLIVNQDKTIAVADSITENLSESQHALAILLVSRSR
jgi:hypothetical protein